MTPQISPSVGKVWSVESKPSCSLLEREMTSCQGSPTAAQGSYLLRGRMQVSCTACPSPQGRTGALLCPDSKGDSQPQTINQEGKGNRRPWGELAELSGTVGQPSPSGQAISCHSPGPEDRETCSGIYLSYTKSKANL